MQRPSTLSIVPGPCPYTSASFSTWSPQTIQPWTPYRSRESRQCLNRPLETCLSVHAVVGCDGDSQRRQGGVQEREADQTRHAATPGGPTPPPHP